MYAFSSKSGSEPFRALGDLTWNDPFVDYASAVWNPHQKLNQVKLEMMQRRAAMFVKSRYKRTDSVTAMLDELGWPILSKKRKDAQLILFYKIINNLTQVSIY